MDALTQKEQERALPEDQRRRGQSALIKVAFTSNLMLQFFSGTVRTLFILSLGGRPSHVGILTTLSSFSPIGQLLGLKLLPRFGKTHLYYLFRLVALLPFIILIFMASQGTSSAALVWTATVVIAAIPLAYTTSNTGWWPLIQDNTAGEALGAFLARMRIRLRLLEVLAPLLVGAYLGAGASTRQFAPLFAVAFLATLLSGLLGRKIPEGPNTAFSSGLIKRLFEAGRVPALRSYMNFTFLYGFIVSLSTPFWIILLKSRGMSEGRLVWLGTVAALGNMSFLKAWGRLVDSHGSRPAINFALIGTALLGLTWLALPSGNGLPLLCWAVGFYLISGFCDSGLLMGTTKAMMNAIPLSHQAHSFTLLGLASAAGCALGGFIGGWCFQWLSDNQVRIGAVDGTAAYLAVVQLSLLVAWWASKRLARYGSETPFRHVAKQTWNYLLDKASNIALGWVSRRD